MATSRVVPMKITRMKVAQVSSPGADFEIVERDIPAPDAGYVRIKVQACGVCHSDVLTKEGLWPGIQYPRVPGHEVAGVIDEVGDGVTAWKAGQRVGVGWHGGQDKHLPGVPARRFSQLPEPESLRHQLRRGISAIHGGSCGGTGGDPGRSKRHRRSASALRRNYHLQRTPPQWCASRRSGCCARCRRFGPPRNSIREQVRL